MSISVKSLILLIAISATFFVIYFLPSETVQQDKTNSSSEPNNAVIIPPKNSESLENNTKTTQQADAFTINNQAILEFIPATYHQVIQHPITKEKLLPLVNKFIENPTYNQMLSSDISQLVYQHENAPIYEIEYLDCVSDTCLVYGKEDESGAWIGALDNINNTMGWDYTNNTTEMFVSPSGDMHFLTVFNKQP